MSRYKPYGAYRDSGSEWLGSIPKHWEVKRLRHLASFANSNVDKKSHDGEQAVHLCNYTDVYYNEFIHADLDFMPATATEGQAVAFGLRAGDVIITKDSEDPRDIGIPAFVPENIPGVVCGYHLTLIRANHPQTAQFIFRAIQSHPSKGYFYVGAPGITRFGLGQDVIGDLPVALPPVPERARIADWIQSETAHIDTLVEKKTLFIDLLKQRRQAIITQAVTKGHSPNVKMKDSGMEWLGKIPEHWQIVRLKFLAEEPLAYGANESADEDNPNWPRFVRITDITEEGTLRDDTFKSLPREVAQPFLLKDGDVLFARSGATVGKSFIYRPTWGEACFAGYLIRLRCDTSKVVPAFLNLFTQSHGYWHQVLSEVIQATIPNFSAERYGELLVCLPPLQEQGQILLVAEREQSRIAGLIEKTNQSIDLLKERRTALVTAAVTGQIDLREDIA